jgi:prepilin-type N-terminal cleavage/methylation domain-containing protein
MYAWFRQGFTLLEVMVVVIIVGILAAVVIPRFASATDDARTASLEATVGGVRSSIAAFRTRAVIEGRDPFPTLDELLTEGEVLAHAIGANPFTGVSGVQAVSEAQASERAVVNPLAAGWNYYVDNAATPPVAVFYANSDDETTVTSGGDGVANANEL